jgi:hypothetical protein
MTARKVARDDHLFPMATNHVIGVLLAWLISVLGSVMSVQAAESPARTTDGQQPRITIASAVRDLLPEEAAKGLPVRLRGVATFVFDRHSCFIQDNSAGIFVGNGVELYRAQ